MRDQTARLLRAAARAQVKKGALLREILLRTIEAEAEDGREILSEIRGNLSPLEERLFEIVIVGEARGADRRVLVPALSASAWFRSAIEVLGGFVNSPPELHIVPDLVDVLADPGPTDPAHISAVYKAIGFIKMSGVWLHDDRRRAREALRRRRAGFEPARFQNEVVAEWEATNDRMIHGLDDG